MKKPLAAFATLASVLAMPAFAGSDMAGMDMSSMSSMSSTMKAPSADALTDAEVRKIDPSTGMITLKHGALNNVGMPPMTMAFKAKDAAMIAQVKAGDKVRVRVEDVNGTLTIVKLDKRS
ncbi:copper-binding protein [Burkholderia ubonensis]|uniref:RND transporter MFP subunit n=1 Tax=Burkholderia ubonensis subsp. mesacidophila TaxID=265293 RepID=A0A2A4FK04_9BURK|nr:copper-binding protein [Burkholderia ubonensis]PCE34053.1 RND transporter MFP subunit [Burkholderia ubonensis subsp. mesacidophila]